jgi:hypothetical protein
MASNSARFSAVLRSTMKPPMIASSASRFATRAVLSWKRGSVLSSGRPMVSRMPPAAETTIILIGRLG